MSMALMWKAMSMPKPVDSVDGAVGVTHSIPVLGFYGNWSDPSMYDQVTYTGVLYGDKTVPLPQREGKPTICW